MVDATFERSVRRWLWAYPRRWRWARVDEVIGTLADLAPPGATRLDVRSGLGLVVHGLATRRRMRPPLAVRLRYWFGANPPSQYRGWVADRIASPFYQGSLWALLVGVQIVTAGSRVAACQSFAGELVFWTVYLVALLVAPRTQARREAALRKLVPRPGDAPTPWDQQPGWVYRDRLGARSVTVPAAWATAVLTVGAAAATVVGRSVSVDALAGCLGVGLALAVRLGIRWRREVPVRPDQPARRAVVAGRRHVVLTWCLAALSLALCWPWTVPFGRAGGGGGVPIIPQIVLGAALVALPVLIVAALLTARGTADLAAVDVLRLIVRRGPLPVDRLRPGPVPAWFSSSVPGGLGETPPPPPTTATA